MTAVVGHYCQLVRRSEHVGGSTLTSKAAMKKQLDLRHALLHNYMEPIARIAKARLPLMPDFLPLRMSKRKPTPQKLSAAA